MEKCLSLHHSGEDVLKAPVIEQCIEDTTGDTAEGAAGTCCRTDSTVNSLLSYRFAHHLRNRESWLTKHTTDGVVTVANAAVFLHTRFKRAVNTCFSTTRFLSRCLSPAFPIN